MLASEAKLATLGHRALRWLYLVHRWLGIATCLLFAIWFVSGLVMIYVPFPALGNAERLAGLKSIDWSKVKIQPAQALKSAGLSSKLRTLSLEMRDREPVWRIAPWDGDTISISAATGRRIGRTDAIAARRIASDFGGAPAVAVTSIMRDQWTVADGFDADRPLWKVELDDPRARVLYVSLRTGAVVLDTDGRERFWNWLGSVPHWIYPTMLRQDNAAWRQVVMWVSGPCIVGAIAGMWIGILRVRIGQRRYRDRRITPYRGWMKWHHVTGFMGGLFLVTWIFSGWLSVDPFRFFASPGIGQAGRISYAGRALPPVLALDRLAIVAKDAKRIEFHWIAGQTLIDIPEGSKEQVMYARTLMPARLDPALIARAAVTLIPSAKIIAVDRLTVPDSY